LYVSFGAVCRATLVFSWFPSPVRPVFLLLALARKSRHRFGKTESQSCSWGGPNVLMALLVFDLFSLQAQKFMDWLDTSGNWWGGVYILDRTD
jgi:hypothetical protein